MFVKISLINVTINDASNAVPPLGILSIAAVLREKGFEVQIIDEDPFFSDPLPRLLSFKPALIGLGFYTPAYSRAKQLALTLRQKFPEALLCAGGVHATALPESTLNDLRIDFCVLGEGEHTLLEVCERLGDGLDFTSVPGLFLSSEGRGKFTGPRPLIEDIDSLPLPARDLLDKRRYLMPPGVFRGRPMERTTSIMTVRGCPFKCTYCGSHIMSKGTVRFRSVASIQRELETLKAAWGVKGIFILDESFTVRRERAIEISSLLKKSGLLWAIQTRVDLLDEDLINIFSENGCVEINFGVESGSDRMLGILKKGTTVEQAVKTFGWCKKAGVRTTANFMLGHPLETTEDIEATWGLAKRLAATYTLFHLTVPYPGTELYRQALAEDWLLTKGEFNDAWMHRSGGAAMLKTQMPYAELEKIRASFQNRFFTKNYLSLRNFRWMLYYAFEAMSHPAALVAGLKSAARSKRLDSFLEVFAAELYRRKTG